VQGDPLPFPAGQIHAEELPKNDSQGHVQDQPPILSSEPDHALLSVLASLLFHRFDRDPVDREDLALPDVNSSKVSGLGSDPQECVRIHVLLRWTSKVPDRGRTRKDET